LLIFRICKQFANKHRKITIPILQVAMTYDVKELKVVKVQKVLRKQAVSGEISK